MRRFGLVFAALVTLFALTPSARASDTDGDGFPDALETVLGTDPSLSTSTPTGSPAVLRPFTADLLVSLNFAQGDSVASSMFLPSVVTPASFEGKKLAFLVGGVAAGITLDATGNGSDGATSGGVFTEGDSSFFFISTFGDLAAQFADEGLTQNVTGTKKVTVDAALFFDGILYTNPRLDGIYEVQTSVEFGTQGFGLFNFTSPEAAFDIALNDVEVFPAPAKINDTVTVSLALKARGINLAEVNGVVDFGDGTQPMEFDGSSVDALSHVYTAEGIYQIDILLIGTQDGNRVSLGATAFAVVGEDAALNAENGLVSRVAIVTAGGTSANFTISSLEDTTVTTASTEFDELDALNPDSAPTGAQNRDVTDGLFPSRNVNKPSMTVAKTTAKTASGQSRGTARKTVMVSSRETNPGASNNPKPPKENAGVVNVTKVSGKFIFKTEAGKNKPDQVSFTGTVTLSEGFSPTSPDGISFAIGLGNVLDGVKLDAKGKPIDKSKGSRSRLKKVAIKFPKLPAEGATGTEVAKISVTMSTEDMDLKGFESEGITNRMRTDEQGRKSVDRMMQVNVMLAGEPYEAYIPVEFKLSKKADAGSMVTRKARQ